MNLHKKIILIIVATYMGLTLILCLVHYLFISHTIEEIEKRDALGEMARAESLLSHQGDALDTQAHDYASRDDIYLFMKNRDADNIRKKFTPSTLTNLKIHHLILVDNGGHIIYGIQFNPSNQQSEPLSGELQRYISSHPALVKHEGVQGSRLGIFVNGKRKILFASRPILRSGDKGPVAGALIMGRYFDENETAWMSRILQLKVYLFDKEDTIPPDDMTATAELFHGSEETIVRTIDSNFIGVYKTIKDILGERRLVLKVSVRRIFYENVVDSLKYTLIALSLFSFVSALAAMLFIKGSVVGRIVKIRQDISSIEASGDIMRRLSVSGDDELAGLGADINRMLDKISSSDDRLRQDELRYRAVVEDQTELICRFRPDGTLTFVNNAYYNFFRHKRWDLLGRHFLSFVPEEDMRNIEDIISRLTPDNPVATYENRVVIPNREELWQEWRTRAIFDTDGHIVEFQAVGRDVTKNKIMETRLRELNKKLEEANAQLSTAYAKMKENRDLLRKYFAMEEPAFIVDRFGKIMAITEYVLEYTRTSRSDILRKFLVDFLPEEDRPFFLDQIKSAWKGITKQLRLTFNLPGGAEITMDLKMTRLTEENRRLILITVIER